MNRQIRVNDVVKVNKVFTCDACGDTFICDYKVTKWYPAETMSFFCSEECQQEVRDKDVVEIHGEPRSFWVYVLQLQDGFYYVGMTLEIKTRLKQHFSGGGALWTRKHPPVKCIYKEETGLFTHKEIRDKENETTILYAELYGYDKVRGGKYLTEQPNWPTPTKPLDK